MIRAPPGHARQITACFRIDGRAQKHCMMRSIFNKELFHCVNLGRAEIGDVSNPVEGEQVVVAEVGL